MATTNTGSKNDAAASGRKRPFAPATSSALPTANSESKNSDRQVCRDFLNGICSRGDSCRYFHNRDGVVEKNRTQDNVYCRDFQVGRCHRRNCKFPHFFKDSPAQPAALPTHQQQHQQHPQQQQQQQLHQQAHLPLDSALIAASLYSGNVGYNQQNLYSSESYGQYDPGMKTGAAGGLLEAPPTYRQPTGNLPNSEFDYTAATVPSAQISTSKPPVQAPIHSNPPAQYTGLTKSNYDKNQPKSNYVNNIESTYDRIGEYHYYSQNPLDGSSSQLRSASSIGILGAEPVIGNFPADRPPNNFHCADFEKGHCFRGDSCKQKHQINPKDSTYTPNLYRKNSLENNFTTEYKESGSMPANPDMLPNSKNMNFSQPLANNSLPTDKSSRYNPHYEYEHHYTTKPDQATQYDDYYYNTPRDLLPPTNYAYYKPDYSPEFYHSTMQDNKNYQPPRPYYGQLPDDRDEFLDRYSQSSRQHQHPNQLDYPVKNRDYHGTEPFKYDPNNHAALLEQVKLLTNENRRLKRQITQMRNRIDELSRKHDTTTGGYSAAAAAPPVPARANINAENLSQPSEKSQPKSTEQDKELEEKVSGTNNSTTGYEQDSTQTATKLDPTVSSEQSSLKIENQPAN